MEVIQMKNLYLNVNEEFKKFIFERKEKPNLLNPLEGGVQYVFHFPNGYGASVIKFFGSYGYDDDLWELGLLKETIEGKWEFEYAELMGFDVSGYLTDEKVNKYLKCIFHGDVDRNVCDFEEEDPE